MKIFISCEKKKSDMNFNQALRYILHTNLINKLVKCVLQYVPKTLNIQRNIFGKIKIIEKTVTGWINLYDSSLPTPALPRASQSPRTQDNIYLVTTSKILL